MSPTIITWLAIFAVVVVSIAQSPNVEKIYSTAARGQSTECRIGDDRVAVEGVPGDPYDALFPEGDDADSFFSSDGSDEDEAAEDEEEEELMEELLQLDEPVSLDELKSKKRRKVQLRVLEV